MDLNTSIYVRLKALRNIFLPNPSKDIIKPITNEKKIDSMEIINVTLRPLMRKRILLYPLSNFGLITYHPQV